MHSVPIRPQTMMTQATSSSVITLIRLSERLLSALVGSIIRVPAKAPNTSGSSARLDNRASSSTSPVGIRINGPSMDSAPLVPTTALTMAANAPASAVMTIQRCHGRAPPCLIILSLASMETSSILSLCEGGGGAQRRRSSSW